MRKTVLVTGARGFIGRNLVTRLRLRPDVEVREYSRGDSEADLAESAGEADVIVHLAGVNRPENEEEFETGNTEFTARLGDLVARSERRVHLLYASSIQATRNNAYGRSKFSAERALARVTRSNGCRVSIFRLPNVFGKWCRPHYNSVVATFCHDIARDLPIRISDPSHPLELVHVDDVIDAFIRALDDPPSIDADGVVTDELPSYRIRLGALADRIRSFRAIRDTLLVPDLSARFDRQLYGTYISYLEPERWDYTLEKKADDRGELAEFIKSAAFGQIFLSRTKPGITRGDHYHHTKTEKFLVIGGEGMIRFRHIVNDETIELHVRGDEYRVVDIPPGYTHSITNTGSDEMVTLFWASEVFDPAKPDTIHLPVDQPPGSRNR